MHDDGGSGATPTFDLRLDHSAARCGRRRCFEFHHFRLQRHHLEQVIDSRTFGGRNRTNDRFAAPILWRETVFLELFFHPVDICSRKIDLVKRNHDFNVRRGFGVVDRFDRLRHQTVIRRDHEHDDVGHLCAA